MCMSDTAVVEEVVSLALTLALDVVGTDSFNVLTGCLASAWGLHTV